MVPSLKFTLIAWVAIIGFGSLSFVLKNKKDATRINPLNTTKGFNVIEPFTSEGFLNCPPANKLITGVRQESKNLPVYQFSRFLYAPPVNGSIEFVGSEEGNGMAGSK